MPKKKKFIIRGTARTTKEKEAKIAIGTLIASSPYITTKEKKKLIRRID